MKTKIKRGLALFMLLCFPVSVITLQSCSKEDVINNVVNILNNILDRTGWLVDDEDMANIPEDITPFDDEGGGTTLQTKVDLSNKFPPIGDQGQYGTCVAWSVGYNLKTALNAIEKGWSSTNLASSSNQTSPKDLWMAIPSGSKGANCGGTNFEPAMDALISSGAASLADVPYSNMGSCSGSKVGNSNNKLANYRKIASDSDKSSLTPENFKGYLNSGRPIAIGARLGDNFMTWNSSSVISTDTYNGKDMQHAYHAMVLVGYDDNKGTRGAFRVRNSWGSSWGDGGSIWVDYNFFCDDFCFAAFVAQNTGNISAGSGGIKTSDLSKGDDLLAYFAKDYPYSGNENYTRTFYYEVYNSGNTTIYPSQNWTVTYMYYNAKNANEYEIIFDDIYTTNGVAKGDMVYNDESTSLAGGYLNNITVAPGQSAGEGYEISYKMPNITGSYYLVVMADAYDVIKEVNEDNNFYFITAANGKPLEFVNGVVKNMPTSAQQMAKKSTKKPTTFSNTDFQTLVKPGNLNTYTPNELRTMLLHDKKTGKLDQKLKAFRAVNGNQKTQKVPVKLY